MDCYKLIAKKIREKTTTKNMNNDLGNRRIFNPKTEVILNLLGHCASINIKSKSRKGKLQPIAKCGFYPVAWGNPIRCQNVKKISQKLMVLLITNKCAQTAINVHIATTMSWSTHALPSDRKIRLQKVWWSDVKMNFFHKTYGHLRKYQWAHCDKCADCSKCACRSLIIILWKKQTTAVWLSIDCLKIC